MPGTRLGHACALGRVQASLPAKVNPDPGRISPCLCPLGVLSVADFHLCLSLVVGGAGDNRLLDSESLILCVIELMGHLGVAHTLFYGVRVRPIRFIQST